MRGKWLWCAVVLGVLCLSWACAGAQTPAGEKPDGAVSGQQAAPVKSFDPAVTKVAVIPFVNELGKQDKEQVEACQQASEFAGSLFAKRGFQVVEAKAVTGAVEKLKLDFKDTEERNKENFQKLADELQANLVIFGVVSEFSTYTHMTLFDSVKVGKAKAEVRLYDSTAKSYLANLVQLSEKQGPRLGWGLANSLALRKKALEIAVETVLKDALKPYPEKAAPKSKR